MSDVSSESYEQLKRQNSEQAVTIKQLQESLELYKFRFEQLEKKLFGNSSEKQVYESAAQLRVFEDEPVSDNQESGDDEDEIEIKAHKRKRNSKKKFSENLETEDIVYGEAAVCCLCCQEELKEFSRDVREEIDFIPERFIKRRHITINKSCPKCKHTTSRGSAPSPVLPGSQMGTGFFVALLINKYIDHLPYYRQSKAFERCGVFIPDKTLSQYGMKLGALLEPVAKAIRDHLLVQDYLQADESRFEVIDEAKKGITHRGQLWVLYSPVENLAYYEYHPSRSKKAAEALLGGYTGALQRDGYVAYEDLSVALELGCLAHARRKFVEAKGIGKAAAKHVIQLIGQLYKIESDLKKCRADFKSNDKWYEERQRVRVEESVPKLDALLEYLKKIESQWLLESSPMHQAIWYMLNRFDEFRAYTTKGQYEIDNNSVERAIRPIAIGRRNWLFSGSHDGARNSAVIYTVIESCKRRRIDVRAYLTDVLPRLASLKTTSLRGLTPIDWKRYAR